MVISLMDWLWKLMFLFLWLYISADFYTGETNKTKRILFTLFWGTVLAMIAFLPDFISKLLK